MRQSLLQYIIDQESVLYCISFHFLCNLSAHDFVEIFADSAAIFVHGSRGWPMPPFTG